MQRFPDNILTRGFDYGFRLSLLQKDIRTACKMAAGVGYHHVPQRQPQPPAD
jgi:3-hydroxyisobutyrate dehydrogenase-like beta-hydroxyacid dehydrogenase